uniref:Protein EARLY FLOWERING 3 n=1 Tax=Opuntia streptacantha TaxID=393608 RepID=A0A7C9EAC6_OPUST
MRRREGNAKFMGPPMFPRLHVNDTEKGGPRAPPRNKMALYEQLTIHSQSCNSGSGVTPTLNPNNNNIGSDPFTSRNQGIDCERRMHLPMDQRSLLSSYSHNELQGTGVVDLSNQPAQMEQGVKTAQKDDPVVHIFSQHRVGQCTVSIHNSGDGGRLLNNGDKKADHSVGDVVARQHGINQGRTLRVSDAPKRYLEISKREKDGVQRGQDKCSLSSSEEIEVCLCQHLGNGLPAVETRFGEGGSDPPMESTQKDISLSLVDNSCIGYGSGDVNGIDNEMRMIDDCSLEMENVERADDMSETSILDSASALDISAEDVVGIIGVKNFLRARSAIVNQQRVLAAQVFELHRLMKVQGLIAGSPCLLLKDSAFIDKTPKDSNMKIYSPEFAATAFAHTTNKNDDPKDPNDKCQCTAENAVSKAPPVLAPKSSPPVNTDPEMNSWSFHQPASHQWLVPMMCPSQGLVYKPCPAPGFMSPVLGGYGPLGSTPAVDNLMNPAYGMPLGVHYGGQGYFHPYGMPGDGSNDQILPG